LAIVGLLFTQIKQTSGQDKQGSELRKKIAQNTQIDQPFQGSSMMLVIKFGVLTMILVTFFQNIAYALSGVFFSVYIVVELGFSSSSWGLLNAGATISGALVSILIGKYYYNEAKIPVLYSILSYMLVYSIFLFSTDPLWIIIAYIIPAYAGTFVAAPAYIALKVPEYTRGTAMGVLNAMQNFGNGFGAIIGGFTAAFFITFRFNYGISVLMCIVPLFLLLFFLKN
jgi:hypothetical protein